MGTILLVTAAAVLAALLGRVVRRRVGFVVEVESVSMAPTLAPGRRVLARRPPVGRALRRGEIVVAESAEVGRPVVKRVVGLPGEHVDVDAAGRVLVGGEVLDEPYARRSGGEPRAFDVPAGHLLLLGDNRSWSSDARSWRQPYLPISAVLGLVLRQRPSSPADAPGPAPRRRAGASA